MKRFIFNMTLVVFISLEIMLISCQEVEISKLQQQLITYKSNRYAESVEKEKELRVMKQDIEKLQKMVLNGEY